mmetsp:Transcript_28353/g.45730  ORF Transcript_28353/g.45730 Transcript_28353/m.45730 type:complete len:207 (-) Transcript_28353:1345-1965(-)
MLLDGLLHSIKSQGSHQRHLRLLMCIEVVHDAGLLGVIALNVNEGAKVSTTIQHGTVTGLHVGLTPLGHEQRSVELGQGLDHPLHPWLLLRILRQILGLRRVLLDVEEAAATTISSPVEAVSEVNFLFEHREIDEVRAVATGHGRHSAAVGIERSGVGHVGLLARNQLVGVLQQGIGGKEQRLLVSGTRFVGQNGIQDSLLSIHTR